MTKTILSTHRDGIHFYLNTETSSPSTGHRNRYRLFKTENYGRDKSGWVQVGSIAGQELIAIERENALFEACEMLFSSKRPQRYKHYGAIRGKPGRWEGEAFPSRQSRSSVETHCKRQLSTADRHATSVTRGMVRS